MKDSDVTTNTYLLTMQHNKKYYNRRYGNVTVIMSN